MKRLIILYSLLLSLIFVSCEVNSVTGAAEFSNWFLWLLAILVIIFIVSMVVISNKDSSVKKELLNEGFNINGLKPFGTYVGGHPSKNENSDHTYILKEDNMIGFYKRLMAERPNKIFSISVESITSINIEDATTMEKRITLGRVLLVGVFALAWKKKKKNELAFIVIDWNDGKFDHATTFSFDGSNAAQLANTARNELIKMCQ